MADERGGAGATVGDDHLGDVLRMVNSVQAAIAGGLSFAAIVDLVGDELRVLLESEDIGIVWLERSTNLLHFLYAYEHGVRLDDLPSNPPIPGGPFEELQRTRRPLIFGTLAEMDASGSITIEGTDAAKSSIMVPIVVGEQVIGMITLDNHEREHAFGENEARL